MAQDTSGLHAVLSHGWAYDLVQRLLGGRRTRKWLQREFICALPGQRVLDVGCGTGDILAALPELDNVAALAEALSTLIARPDDRARLGAAGRERVLKRYRSGRLVADIQSLYREGLEAKRGVPILWRAQ